MADSGAIRDIGETLVDLVRGATAGVVDPANVRVVAPRDLENFDGGAELAITVFLYRVGIVSEMRNGTFRTLPDGSQRRPPLPLELGFMVTPWAKDASQANYLAGVIVRTLYDAANLSSAQLRGAGWNPQDSAQIVLESLPIADHFRVWDSARVPYRTSLAYAVRVIGIDSTERFHAPRVVDVTAAIGGRGQQS
ncbi:MAG: DUF4255 domain-containing protein [Kofleriaceae bacterium]